MKFCLLKRKIFEFVFLATERSYYLEDFVQRLLEPPTGQHFHSVSINKNQLVERYGEILRGLIERYPTFFNYKTEQQLSLRSNLITPIQIPVVIHQQPRTIHRIHRSNPRGTSPMQQGDDEQESLPPSSS